ncbi:MULTISPECIES: hypothetical protein [Nostocales]|jgi:hypothetical protein|nr:MULTISPECIES: hypothetical protein [Nostocales]
MWATNVLPPLINPPDGIGGNLSFPPGFLPGFPLSNNTFGWKVV